MKRPIPILILIFLVALGLILTRAPDYPPDVDPKAVAYIRDGKATMKAQCLYDLGILKLYYEPARNPQPGMQISKKTSFSVGLAGRWLNFAEGGTWLLKKRPPEPKQKPIPPN